MDQPAYSECHGAQPKTQRGTLGAKEISSEFGCSSYITHQLCGYGVARAAWLVSLGKSSVGRVAGSRERVAWMGHVDRRVAPGLIGRRPVRASECPGGAAWQRPGDRIRGFFNVATHNPPTQGGKTTSHEVKLRGWGDSFGAGRVGCG